MLALLLLACSSTPKDDTAADTAAGDDTAADSGGDDSAADSGGDTGADSGGDSGEDTATDSGGDSGDTGADTGDTGSSDTGGDTGTSSAPTWSADVYPLLTYDCLDCHERWGRSSSEVYAELSTASERGYPMISPGDPSASFLYMKVAEASPPAGDQMPLQLAAVSADELAAFGDFITNGAVDDTGFAATFGVIWSRYECRACHSDWEGGDGRFTLAEAEALGDSGYSFLVPGDPGSSLLYLKMTSSPPFGQQMPQQIPLWGKADIATLGAWITAGAVED